MILLVLIALGGFVLYREFSDQRLEKEITELTETMNQEEDDADPSDLDNVDEASDSEAVMTGDAEIDAELDELAKELDSIDEAEANGNPLSDL